MHFTRLRLTGFKSFVDPTDIHIEPGLTGVVGPNGCGKSNIVEGLRWVMGEAAPKRMRGGEMDDVIFAGTADRPPRDVAEVLLGIDNADRSAPATYNHGDDLEVTRRIERGAGSLYRINGREARARDVQTLFADSASGARSTAMVSQGRIGEVIAAKPTDRRGILEEAAGIGGLHARRREAELRLHAAETNLERLDDVIGTLEEQHRALKRQARQAARYRNLSDRLRRVEAMLLHRRWSEAADARTAAQGALREAGDSVAELGRVAAAATVAHEREAQALPELRAAEREAAGKAHELRTRLDGLEAEERRIEEAKRTLAARLDQLDGDLARERGRGDDARKTLDGLDAEAAELRSAEDGLADADGELAARLQACDRALAESEALRDERLRALAGAESRSEALDRRLEALAAQERRLEARHAEFAREQAGRPPLAGLEAALAGAETAAADAAGRLDASRARREAAEAARAAAGAAHVAAEEAAGAAAAEAGRAEAEAGALADLLDAADSGGRAPVMDAVSVTPGYEAALGAALGDDLLAPADEAAPVHWRDLGGADAGPSLPPGARPLSEEVSAPAELRRRLSQIGVIDDGAAAFAAGALAQGQRLVAKSGAMWRWDGYRIAAGAETAAAVRMAQRNRLDALREVLDVLGAERAARARTAEAAGAALRDAEAECEAARGAERDAEAEANGARAAAADGAARLDAAQLRRAADEDAREALETELAETRSQRAEALRAREALPDLAAAAGAVDEAQGELARRRAESEDARRDRQRHLAEAEARRRRMAAIDSETASWRARAAESARHAQDLEARRREARAERETLDSRPGALARERAETARGAAEAREVHRLAEAALADAEARAGSAERALRAAEARLAESREDMVRREAALEQADRDARAAAALIRERFDCAPDGALRATSLDETVDVPDSQTLQERLERHQRERDNMGPVNLRADIEADEIEERISATRGEREDLTGAISRLRRGTAELDREARGRLRAAFEAIDGHFRTIFTRLFGGGEARLALTEAEDPFACGLEVMASPPGKRLQAMSLMSGGEQALTAISLLFAVFRTNPAPICVLDEADAALDDHNVDRFCDLLAEVAAETDTRFLVITHHRLTMARMDRLYGITMPERGVSQLVSVDLRAAERLRGHAEAAE